MEWKFDFCAGHLALDFANTVNERTTALGPIERLPTWREVVRFALQAKLVSKAEYERLLAWGLDDPDGAEALRRQIVELREACYRTFVALARKERPSPADLDVVNEWLRRLRLDTTLEWVWDRGPGAPDASLAHVLRATRDLLTDPTRRGRLRMCDAVDECAWVFLDTSKNHSRRWCDMKQCGNRDKVRRFYARHHS